MGLMGRDCKSKVQRYSDISQELAVICRDLSLFTSVVCDMKVVGVVMHHFNGFPNMRLWGIHTLREETNNS